MSPRVLACLMVTVLTAGAFVACSDQSPVGPRADSDGAGDVGLVSQSVPGTYTLSFFKNGPNGFEPVSTLSVCVELVVCEELWLGAHVDASGVPAQSGSAAFQYCSYKGLPPNDITRADEAPSSACANGSATWANLPRGAISVDTLGDAFFNFGAVKIPRTVGFRFRYLAHGSGIANGVSAPSDFTWCPLSGCQ
jgi:hypothetical protein